MRHLRLESLEIALLSSCVFGSPHRGRLIAPSGSFEALSPANTAAVAKAVDVATITPTAHHDQNATSLTIVQAVGIGEHRATSRLDRPAQTGDSTSRGVVYEYLR